MPNVHLASSGYFSTGDDGIVALYIATNAFLLYEYVLTINLEVQHVWCRKKSGATVLFFLARYLPITNRFIILGTLLPVKQTYTSCLVLFTVNQVLSFLDLCTVALISALRVYAIWALDYRVFIPVLLLGLISPFVNTYLEWTSTVSVLSFQSSPLICQLQPNNSGQAFLIQLRTGLTIGSRVSNIVSELLVLILTWIRTFSVYKLALAANTKSTLARLILRDGTLYFAAILSANMISIYLIRSTVENSLSDLVTTTSSVLVSRFILNLRQIYFHPRSQTLPSIHSTLRFASSTLSIDVVGPLGAPVGLHEDSQYDVDGHASDDENDEQVVLSEDPLLNGLRLVVGRLEYSSPI